MAIKEFLQKNIAHIREKTAVEKPQQESENAEIESIIAQGRQELTAFSGKGHWIHDALLDYSDEANKDAAKFWAFEDVYGKEVANIRESIKFKQWANTYPSRESYGDLKQQAEQRKRDAEKQTELRRKNPDSGEAYARAYDELTSIMNILRSEAITEYMKEVPVEVQMNTFSKFGETVPTGVLLKTNYLAVGSLWQAKKERKPFQAKTSTIESQNPPLTPSETPRSK